jgi:hypothetical protein
MEQGKGKEEETEDRRKKGEWMDGWMEGWRMERENIEVI